MVIFLVTLFFMLCPSICRKQCNLEDIYFPISLLSQNPFYRSRPFKKFVKSLLFQTRRICRIMSQNVALNNSTQNHLNTNNDTHSRSPLLADHNHQELSKEQTVTQHTNPDARQSERPLTTRNNGKRYRTNPTNVYISKWKDGFQRFLACGAS